MRSLSGTCYGTASFTITVNDNPDVVTTPLSTCESGGSGQATFNLNNGVTNADGGTLTFHLSQAAADAGTGAIATPASYTTGSTTIYVRSLKGICVGTASFTITISDNPDVVTTPLSSCESGATSQATFNLNNGVTNADGGTLTFHLSQAAADAGTGAIATPASYTTGSTTIYVRSVNGSCVGTGSFTITVNDNPDVMTTPLSSCESGATGQATFNLNNGVTNADGGTLTFHLSQAAANAGTAAIATPASYTTGNTTIYVRSLSGTCFGTASFTITVNDNPDVVTTPLSSCETGATDQATFNLTNGVTNADGGTLTFHLSQAAADAGTGAIATPAAYTTGSTTIYVRSLSGTCYGTALFAITVNPNPALMITNPATVCEGVTVDLTAAAVTSGSTLEGGDLSYWTDPAATLPLATPSAVMAGTYYIKVLNTAGCMDIEPVMVTEQPCGGALCTYTQGYYGNPGGMSCADGEQFTTMDLIAKALASYGGTMTIGSPGHSVFMTAPDDIDDIIRVLPGGGGSYALLAGNIQISSSGFSSYLRKGNINNTLLAQTITLGLNLGIDSELGDFVLQSGTLATAAPEGGCGFDTPMPRSCSEEGYMPVINEYQYFAIPAVVDLLPVKTVQGLFDMANYALGGGDLSLYPGITLSALANAVDMINNAFDGCRISMGYEQTLLVCNTSSKQEFVAFEVPIVNNQLTIKYKFGYVSDVTIDVFDAATGAKVFSKIDTNSYLDKEVKIDYNFNTGTQKVYIVRLTTRLGHDEQKVLSSPY